MNLVDGAKARAAANPAAVLLIGVGAAWRIIRHRPIATALVGAGSYSLVRSKPLGPQGQPNTEYVGCVSRPISYERCQTYAAEPAVQVRAQAKDQRIWLAQQVSKRKERRPRPGIRLRKLRGRLRCSCQTGVCRRRGDVRDARLAVLADQRYATNFCPLFAGLSVAAAFGIASQRR